MIDLVTGNCIDVMDSMDKHSVHMVVTSPPYWGMRRYNVEPTEWGGSIETMWKGQLGNEPDVSMYIDNLLFFFEKLKRVLRPDGTVWFNIGDCHKKGQHVMIPDRLAIALQDAGWMVVSRIIWAKGVSFTKAGSYVGSLMPQSVKKRPSHSYEDVLVLAKGPKYFYDHIAVREKGVYPVGTKAAKGSTNRRKCEGVNARPNNYKVYDGMRNLRDVWCIPIERVPEEFKHYSTFPVGLALPTIKAATSEHGVCASCGAQYNRLVKPTEEYEKLLGKDWANYETDNAEGRGHFDTGAGTASVRPTKRGVPSVSASYVTIGWQKMCDCDTDKIKPATVFDPFGGLASSGIAAHILGRDSIMVELDRNTVESAQGYIKYRIGDVPVTVYGCESGVLAVA